MATERKPLYITISSIHQFELPTTASAGGLDLNTGKNIYYNTSSLHWETQNAFTGSITKLANGSDYLVASGAITLTTTSVGAVKIGVFEEFASYTPVLSFSGGGTPIYASQTGDYYRIGKQVIVNFALALSNLNGVTGDVTIANLPFTTISSNNGVGSGQVPVYKNINNSHKVSAILIHIKSNQAVAELYHVTNPEANSVPLTVNNLTNTTELSGSLYYLCS